MLLYAGELRKYTDPKSTNNYSDNAVFKIQLLLNTALKELPLRQRLRGVTYPKGRGSCDRRLIVVYRCVFRFKIVFCDATLDRRNPLAAGTQFCRMVV